MKKYRTFTFTLLILFAIGILIFRSCRYDWNPHYLGNSEVTIGKKLCSPDSSEAVANYSLHVGARGIRFYKSLLRKKDYSNDFTKYALPPEIVVLNWVDNRILNVKYDPNEILRLGEMHTELNFNKDTIVINDVSVIIKQRIKENSDSVFHQNFGKYYEK